MAVTYPDRQLSNNFWLSEYLVNLRDSDLTHFDEQALNRIIALNNNLMQPIRDRWGRVKINSGYRSVRKNRAVDGSSTSWHLYGAAADFYTPDANLFEVWCWVQQWTLLNNIVLTECHLYQGHIHIAYVIEDNDRDIKITSGNYPDQCNLMTDEQYSRMINIYDQKRIYFKARYYFWSIIRFMIILIIILLL